ncbi:MAG: cytochrome c oxidase subunit II, partial [Cyanobacteria bacterium J06623_1]
MNIPSSIITLIAGVAMTLISLWYGQNHGLLPTAASSDAGDVDQLFNFMMTIATGLFLLVEGVLVYSVIKFRRKKGDTTDGPPIEGNVPLEIVWTAIPTVIVFILSIYSFEIYNRMGGLDPMAAGDPGPQLAHIQHHSQLVALDPEQQNIALGLGVSPDSQQGDNPLEIKVNGIQYAWIFTYPETGVVSGEIHVPVNRPVALNMTGGDVIHAFWLPEFRI